MIGAEWVVMLAGWAVAFATGLYVGDRWRDAAWRQKRAQEEADRREFRSRPWRPDPNLTAVRPPTLPPPEAPIMKHNKCATCIYLNDDDNTCHRNAPAPGAIGVQGGGPQLVGRPQGLPQAHAVFPVVDPIRDFCGEHRRYTRT